jgi:hypothetical protein
MKSLFVKTLWLIALVAMILSCSPLSTGLGGSTGSRDDAIDREVEERAEETLAAIEEDGDTEDIARANEFVNEYGFAATFTGDDDYGAMAVHVNGEQLIAMTETDSAGYVVAVNGGIWVSPDGEQTAVVYSGPDGLPTRAVVGDYIYVYENYTDSTVDVAVLYPGGEIEVHKEVPIEPELINELRTLSQVGVRAKTLPGELQDELDLATTLRLAGLAVGTAICVAGFIAGGAPGLACLGALVSAISLAMPDSAEMEMSSNAIGSFHCARTVIDATGLTECVPFALEFAGSIIVASEETQEDHETAINLAEASLVYGSGDVQITLTWDNESDVDLWVTDPSGEKIYFDHPYSRSGGQLDVDDRNGFGPENIFWPTGEAPSGEYRVQVHHYYGSGVANYQVLVQVNGQSFTYTGSLAPDEVDDVTVFTQ